MAAWNTYLFADLVFKLGIVLMWVPLAICGWIFAQSCMRGFFNLERNAREITFREETSSDPLMDSIEEQLPSMPVVEAGSGGKMSSPDIGNHDEEQGTPRKGIPTYHKGERIEESEDNCCSICLGNFAVGDLARRLPCGHAFHRDCVDAWLIEQGGRLKGSIARCPVCRTVALNLPTNPLVLLEGDWVRDRDSKFMGRIEAGQLEWMNGTVVNLGSRRDGTISAVCGTTTHTASCGEDGLLRWSDGDVWRRTSIAEELANGANSSASEATQIEMAVNESLRQAVPERTSSRSEAVSNSQRSSWCVREELASTEDQPESPEGERAISRPLLVESSTSH